MIYLALSLSLSLSLCLFLVCVVCLVDFAYGRVLKFAALIVRFELLMRFSCCFTQFSYRFVSSLTPPPTLDSTATRITTKNCQRSIYMIMSIIISIIISIICFAFGWLLLISEQKINNRTQSAGIAFFLLFFFFSFCHFFLLF